MAINVSYVIAKGKFHAHCDAPNCIGCGYFIRFGESYAIGNCALQLAVEKAWKANSDLDKITR